MHLIKDNTFLVAVWVICVIAFLLCQCLFCKSLGFAPLGSVCRPPAPVPVRSPELEHVLEGVTQ